jgi:hypothetical protein
MVIYSCVPRHEALVLDLGWKFYSGDRDLQKEN